MKLSPRLFISFGTFLIAFTLTALLAYWTHEEILNSKELQFQVETSQIESSLETQMGLYQDVIIGGKGLFAASQNVESSEWDEFARTLSVPTRYDGISALMFIQRIPSTDASSSPVPIFPLQPTPAAYYPITYLESFTSTTTVEATSSNALGFDVNSEARRRAALDRARDTNSPAATSIVLAVNSNNPSFSIYEPIYANGAPFETISERRAALTGYVAEVFSVKTLFASLFDQLAFDPDIDVDILDAPSIGAASKSDVLFDSGNDSLFLTHGTSKAISRVTSISVAGETWTLLFTARPSYQAGIISSYATPIVFVIGTIFSFLLAYLLYLFALGREQALNVAERLTHELFQKTEDLESEKQKDEALLGAIGDAVFAIDASQEVILFNAVAETISGFTAAEAIGKHYTETLKFINEDTGAPKDDFILTALGGKKTQMANHTAIVRKDGSHIQVADSASPVKNSSGKVVGVIVVFRDVTHEREVDKAKTEFVSLASHQLRTPLSAIGWYTELLMDEDAGKLTAKQRELLGQIGESNVRMVDLVNSLLNVSRIDMGTLASDPVPTDLVATTESILAELAPAIDEQKLHIEKEFASSPLMLNADPKLIRIVIQNLLSNAVKYTPEKGTVRIELAKEVSSENAEKKLRITVADTGMGIPKEQQGKIFEKLFRADNAKEKVTDGSGLGLYMVRSIVLTHGGEIHFESQEDAGTTFTITLPATGMKKIEGSKTLS